MDEIKEEEKSKNSHNNYTKAIIISSIILSVSLIYMQNQKIEFAKYQMEQKQLSDEYKKMEKEDKETLNNDMREKCLVEAYKDYSIQCSSKRL